MMLRTTLILLISIGGVVISAFLFDVRPDFSEHKVTSYAECVASGYPYTTSIPRTCTTSKGREFKELPQTTVTQNEFMFVSEPVAYSRVSSPVTVLGAMRGGQVTESFFNVTLMSDNGILLGSGSVELLGDVYSEGEVFFRGDISYVSPSTTPGLLIISSPGALFSEFSIPLTFGQVKAEALNEQNTPREMSTSTDFLE